MPQIIVDLACPESSDPDESYAFILIGLVEESIIKLLIEVLIVLDSGFNLQILPFRADHSVHHGVFHREFFCEWFHKSSNYERQGI